MLIGIGLAKSLHVLIISRLERALPMQKDGTR